MKKENKPKCQLIGTDGNIFFLMGKVGQTLKKHGMHEKAKEMSEKVMHCGSYEQALIVLSEYVEIQ
jgi:hypothetical protein